MIPSPPLQGHSEGSDVMTDMPSRPSVSGLVQDRALSGKAVAMPLSGGSQWQPDDEAVSNPHTPDLSNPFAADSAEIESGFHSAADPVDIMSSLDSQYRQRQQQQQSTTSKPAEENPWA